LLAGEDIPCEPLADDLTHGKVKAFAVVQLAIIEAVHLFIEVTEQVERLNRNVGSVQAALQETPEIFHSIGVDVPVNVGHGVVDHLVLKFVESVVGLQRIAVERGTCLNVPFHEIAR
jgi:hypothetical protein